MGGMIPPYDLRRSGNTLDPTATSLPTPPTLPLPFPPPPSLPPTTTTAADKSPPTTRARRPLPIPKEGAPLPPKSWTPLLPAASTSTISAPPPAAARTTKVKAPPVKRIKLTPEESKARTAARSAAAGKVRLEKRRAAKAEYATRCVTLEAENKELKDRVELLERELGARGRAREMEGEETDRFSTLEGDIETGDSVDGNAALSPTLPNPFRAQLSPVVQPFSPHLSTSGEGAGVGGAGGGGGKEEIVMTREERQNVALLLQWASNSRLASSFGLGLGLQQ